MKNVRSFILLLAVVVISSTVLTACCPPPVASSTTISPPVLSSAVEMYKDGQKGLWMDEHDVANLMIWINNVSSR